MADDDTVMSYSDFSSQQDRTVAEQRANVGSVSRRSFTSTGSSATDGGGSRVGGLLRGSSKLLGNVGSAVGGGVTAVAGGVASMSKRGMESAPSTGQVAGALQGGISAVAGGVSAVASSVSGGTARKGSDGAAAAADSQAAQADAPGGTDAAGRQLDHYGRPFASQTSDGSLPPPPPPQSSSSGLGKTVSSVAGGVAGGVTAVAGGVAGGVSQLAGGLTGGMLAATSRFGGRAGTAAGDPGSELALGLLNASFELMAASLPACGSDDPVQELAGHIDATVACGSLCDLGARLLDFWYVLRPDALTTWSLLQQRQWVQVAYVLKYGDLRRAPRPLARAACGLLLELADGFRPGTLTWRPAEADLWAKSLRALGTMADESPPPSGWIFPSMSIARNPPGVDDVEFGQTTFAVLRSDVKGVSRISAQEVVLSLKTGGMIRAPRQSVLPLDTQQSAEVAKEFVGSFEELVSSAGGPALQQKVMEKSTRLFNQKTKPIMLHNQASTALKACMYSFTDRLCAVPVGGMGGPCVTTLEPNCRAQMRPPGTAQEFQLKVMQPGLIEKNLYFVNVARGQSVQLRSHDCTVETK